jgi:hypothetical protein
LTAFVDGTAANDYKFTSALPLSVLKITAPTIQPYMFPQSKVEQKVTTAGDKPIHR